MNPVQETSLQPSKPTPYLGESSVCVPAVNVSSKTKDLELDQVEPVRNAPPDGIFSRYRNDFIRGLLFPARTKYSIFDGESERVKTFYGEIETIKMPANNPKTAKFDILFIHGNMRSANQCAGDILPLLANYGNVRGINLPGYEQSTPPFGGKKLAEISHVAGARALASHVKVDLEKSGRDKKDLVVVTRSVGTYLGAQIAKELSGVHMICIVPLASLEEVKITIPHTFFEIGRLKNWAQGAFPKEMTHGKVLDFSTNCFDTGAVLRQAREGFKTSKSKLTFFCAQNDTLLPEDTGDQLTEAAGCGDVIFMQSGDGHRSLPSATELDLFFNKLNSVETEATVTG